ncbi:AsmA family protein [Rhodobacter sp. Har01]|uniref:AsmA family protein n=1 Tax=Rhodobacter sp. Har01 TaxID=2883999 RepID=UPI001D063CCA|nr:AsmA family protein [Rhodobacter sp. Har01]MCB6178280.1 AsmA family protein [Rhodobacter sp. Har01]
MRWLVRALGALLVLALVGAGLLALVPAERVAQAAAAQFERLTGRKLEFDGEVSPRFWPVLGVTTGPVRIANADWSTEDGPMFAAESLQIEINATALMGGEIQILGLRAERPEILLERSKDGQENWVFGGGGAVSPATPGVGTAYTLADGRIEGGTIRYIDHASGRRIALDGVDATLQVPDFTGPFTLDLTAVSGGEEVALTAEGGVFSAFTEGRVVPMTLTARAGVRKTGSSLAFEGRAGWSPLAAEGALTADLSDLEALGHALGADTPILPRGLGAERLTMEGQLTLDGTGAAYLRGATIIADTNQITGDLDLKPGEARPMLSAQLRSGPLLLAGLWGERGGGVNGGMKADGWPKETLDVSALGAVDAAVSLVAPSVDLGLARLGETRLLLTIDRARAVFDIRQMAAYGGTVTGQFVVNGRGGLSVGGDLTLKGLDMQPLMTDLSGWERLVAKGNLTLKFLGVGNSVDEIMQGLKGDGTLSLGKGELRGLDIAGMLRTLDPGFVGEGQKTIFDGVAGSFAIADGVLSNSDLKLVAPGLTATGSGEVGLGKRELNYRLRPTALAAADGSGGVMVPLLITGPWAAPRFRLDMESIAREKMEAEARAAEDRLRQEAAEAEAAAKAALEAKLAEEGIVAGDGETLQDAARRKAQEALTDEAGKLLDDILNGN